MIINPFISLYINIFFLRKQKKKKKQIYAQYFENDNKMILQKEKLRQTNKKNAKKQCY
jgi:hypothetical protein